MSNGNVILVNSQNIDATIIEKDNGKYEWLVTIHTPEGPDYFRPVAIPEFPSRERALVSMNEFLAQIGFRPQETITSPVTIPNPYSWDDTAVN